MPLIYSMPLRCEGAHQMMLCQWNTKNFEDSFPLAGDLKHQHTDMSSVQTL